jgi:hypothetical protein
MMSAYVCIVTDFEQMCLLLLLLLPAACSSATLPYCQLKVADFVAFHYTGTLFGPFEFMYICLLRGMQPAALQRWLAAGTCGATVLCCNTKIRKISQQDVVASAACMP